MASISTGSATYVINQIPLNAFSIYVHNSVHRSLPVTNRDLDKSLRTLDNVVKITLYNCERINQLGYSFNLLRDSIVPVEER